ncbi:MAG TPA: hypothetical protein VM537_06780 [Anaerolineae bacterium]|nr:hypothetical protein [Anaerolineae bacterium]
MPATSQPAIEAKLRELMAALEVDLGPGELRRVTPAQAALLDFFRDHPFGEFAIEVRAGEPYLAREEWEKGVERFLLTK